jgi:RNA polymerase sigma factor (sigma-70 family)
MEGFDHWYEAEHARVLGVCAALSGDRDAAADATDEAFARAMDRWDRVGTLDKPGAWVQVVALNYLRRALRRRGRERFLHRGSHGLSPELALPNPELWVAVRELPERQRLAVVLRYVADRPEAEIAEIMGVTRGTVAATLSAARSRLASVLRDDEIIAQEVTRG